MNYRLLFIGLVLAGLAGCRTSTCWKKPSPCACPPGPIVGAVPARPGAAGEVIYPQPVNPGEAAPVPYSPLPGTPAPSGSYYLPAIPQANPPARTGNIVRLESPTFGPAVDGQSKTESLKPAGPSEPVKTGASDPAGLAGFTPVTDGVTAGRRPTLDGLDWLRTNGYRTAVVICSRDASDAADQKLFEMRGIKLTRLDVGSDEAAAADRLSKLMSTADGPVYVYELNQVAAAGLWYEYFRRAEMLPDDVAKVRVGGLSATHVAMRQSP